MGDTVSTLLFQPPPPTKLKKSKLVWLNNARGKRIPAFYIEYPAGEKDGMPRSLSASELEARGGGSGVTLLYSHANAEDLGSIYPWCKFLSKVLRVNVFAYDYTGYGMAYYEGEPSEENCYADIDAAYGFLRNKLNVPASNIVLYGRSLGSGPSCYLASRTADEADQNGETAVGGLILHAPFLSVFRIVLDSGCTLPGDHFPNVDFAPMVQSPVFLIHGTKDKIVPVDHSHRLQQAFPKECRTAPLIVNGMGHNNVHSLVRDLFVQRLRGYLEDYVLPNTVDIRKRGNPKTKSEKFRINRKKMPEIELKRSISSCTLETVSSAGEQIPVEQEGI